MVHAVLGSSANLVNMSHLSGFNFPGKAFLPPPPPDSMLPPVPVVIPLPRLKLSHSQWIVYP